MPSSILIVDDEPLVRKLLDRILGHLDCDIFHAADGDQAVEIAKKKRPKVILLDLHMPQLDGLAALEEILAYAPKTKVIVISGDDSEARIRTLKEAGASEYFTKPFDINALLEAVKSLLVLPS